MGLAVVKGHPGYIPGFSITSCRHLDLVVSNSLPKPKRNEMPLLSLQAYIGFYINSRPWVACSTGLNFQSSYVQISVSLRRQ